MSQVPPADGIQMAGIGQPEAGDVQPEQGAANPVDHVDGNAQAKAWWLPGWAYNPWSDDATIGFLTRVADASLVGHVPLFTIFGMYLWAWAKPGAICIHFFNATALGYPKYVPSVMQVLSGVLPFFLLPVEASISGMARALKNDRDRMGTIAALCLVELFFSIILLAGILTCMTGWPFAYVGIGAGGLTVLLVLWWSLSFKHPKCLRSFVWSICFRQAAQVPQVPAPNAAGLAGNVDV